MTCSHVPGPGTSDALTPPRTVESSWLCSVCFTTTRVCQRENWRTGSGEEEKFLCISLVSFSYWDLTVVLPYLSSEPPEEGQELGDPMWSQLTPAGSGHLRTRPARHRMLDLSASPRWAAQSQEWLPARAVCQLGGSQEEEEQGRLHAHFHSTGCRGE